MEKEDIRSIGMRVSVNVHKRIKLMSITKDMSIRKLIEHWLEEEEKKMGLDPNRKV